MERDLYEFLTTRRRVLASIAICAAFTMLVLPFAAWPGPHVPGLVAMFAIGIFITELATGAVLLSAFDAEGRWSFLLLGGAYLFSGLMAVAHVLTFDEALLSNGAVLPVSSEVSGWLIASWVTIFSAACLAAVVAELVQHSDRERQGHRRLAIVAAIFCVAALFGTIVGSMVVFDGRWAPRIAAFEGRWAALNVSAITLTVVVNVVSIVCAFRTRRAHDQVFLWLALALAAMACAMVIAHSAGSRFTVGWIVGRVAWLFSAGVLFVYFMVQHVGQSLALRRSNALLTDEIQESTGRLRASEARLAAIVSTTSEAILSKSPDGKITSWNEGAAKLLKFTPDEIIGRSIRDLIPGNRQGDEDEVFARIAAGESVDNYETVRLDKDGNLVEVSMTVSPLIVHGKLVGASSVMHDISARKARERHTNMLLREINHRSKNLLAVVQAVARQTVANSPNAFLTSFNERLQALAVSQDLLVKSHWRGVDLADLVHIELSRYSELIGARIHVSGSPVIVSAAAAQNLGMALHELATNAGKFGPLGGHVGRVDIGWTTDGDARAGRLHMHWIERGGPEVLPPSKTGFGTALTTDVLRIALNGSVRLDYNHEGIEWHLEAPLANIVETERAL